MYIFNGIDWWFRHTGLEFWQQSYQRVNLRLFNASAADSWRFRFTTRVRPFGKRSHRHRASGAVTPNPDIDVDDIDVELVKWAFGGFRELIAPIRR